MSRRKSSSKQKPGITKGEAKRGATTPPQAPQLHREDAALWAEVTKSLTPLKRDHDRLHFGPLLDEKPDMPNWRWPPAPENAGDQGADAWNNGKRAQKQPSVAGLEMPRQGTPIDHLPEVGNQFTSRDMRRIDQVAASRLKRGLIYMACVRQRPMWRYRDFCEKASKMACATCL